ncbi:PKD domain-containing protein, partial [Flavobacteriales bacterium]|nr:PKD domain-containing protein [Flavobacteriales bacterium]
NDVWVGGVNIWQSTDGGASWINRALWSASGQTNYLHADIHELEFSHHNNTLFVCSDGGFGKRSGGTWEDLSEDLEITQFYSVGIAESIQDNVIGGAQDNGTLHHRNDYTSADNWTAQIGGDGMQCIIHPTNSDIMYSEIQNGRIFKTTNGGTNWTEISPDSDGAWETPYELQPNNPSRMLAGYKRLYLSTDGGDTWTALNSTSGLLNGSNTLEIEMTTNNNIFYFSFNDKLFRTTNGGSNWTDISSGLVNQATITDIHSSPNNANHIWVTFGGTWNANNKVFHSTDGGNNWTNISYNLPNTQVNCITFDADENNTYVGTDLGVYVRVGSASSWNNHNLSSLPNVIVKDLEINETNHFLYAGTHGRGVWKIDISDNIAPIVEFSANPPEVCANQSIQFTDESVGSPTSWSWNFGDGNTSTAQNPSHIYTIAGTYSVTLTATNSNGNDTETKSSYITVHPASTTQSLTVTACEEYIYTGGLHPVTYTTSGTYTIVSAGGCLTTTLNLTIEEEPWNTWETIVACESYTWDENNETYTTSGLYEYHEEPATPGGCSQGHWLNLTIIPNEVQNITTCDSYEINGVTHTSSGTYYETLGNCTTKTVHLTIIQSADIEQDVAACDNYTWSINGETYNQSGTYSHTVPGGASNGCDQDYILNLTINSAEDISTDITACETYSWHGNTYTQSGTYSTTLTDGNGCQYTSFLNLIILQNNTSEETTVVECFEYTWPINGQTYTNSGTYTATETLSSGCIVNHTLYLSILNGSQNLTFNETATGSFTWLGTTYYCSGTYTATFNQNGCTFNGTLNLTINNSVYEVFDVTNCDSYYWDFNQTSYNSSGYYTSPYTINGCTTNKALDLTINNSTTSLTSVTADDFYTWNGETYYCSGTYSITLTNSVGCDSTATLNLNLNNGW